LALNQKGKTVGNLGGRRIDTEVPHSCGEGVFAQLESGTQIERLVSPVIQVTPCRPISDPFPIQVENEAVVGADMDYIVANRGIGRKGSPEVQSQWLTEWSGRV
jgi:hypothetical protein